MVCIWLSEATAQPVPFVDVNLKAAVEAELGVTDPTVNDILGFTSFNNTSAGITSLVGLEFATNITSLSLKSNPRIIAA